MKIRNMAVLAALMLGCLACTPGAGNTRQGAPALEEEDNKPVVKQEKAIDSSGSYIITDYDEHGNELKKSFYDKNGKLTVVYTSTYDENLNLLTEVRTDSEGNVENYEKYVYDRDGNLIEEYEGDNEKELVIQNRYEYKSGKLVKDIFYGLDENDIFWINVYEYNDKGLLVKKSHESEDGYVYRTYEYEYDKNDNLIKMTDMSYGKCPHIYFYDSEERVIKEEYYGEDGELSFATENKYGKYGLEESITTGRIPSHTVIEYENNGQTVTTYSVAEDGTKKETRVKTYDKDGNLLHSYSPKDALLGYSEFEAEYNEYGLPVKTHSFCNEAFRDIGPVDETTEFEYIYY